MYGKVSIKWIDELFDKSEETNKSKYKKAGKIKKEKGEGEKWTESLRLRLVWWLITRT